MSDVSSPYYPPRAGWTRRVYSAVHFWRRRLHLERLSIPRLAVTPSRSILALLLPGYSFWDAGWKVAGRLVACAWVMAGLVFVVALGYPFSNLAFGMMISLHVSSILHLINRIAPGMQVLKRLVLSLAVLFVVAQVFYWSGLKWFEKHFFMPVQSHGKVYVIDCSPGKNSIRPGDLVNCRFEHVAVDGVYIHEGYSLSRVIAAPLDRVEFSRVDFRINGVASPRLPYMPTTGQWIVPKNAWLIWPSLDIVRRNNASEESIAQAVLNIATVSRQNVMGKPFRRWFWRRQIE